LVEFSGLAWFTRQVDAPSWAGRTFPASMYFRGIKKGDAIKLPSRRTLF
jgi:hypothetical protein